MRLPLSFSFPFAPRIEIRQVSSKELKDLLDEDEGEADGLWDADTRTIYILKTLPLKRKRYVLWHELLKHAAADVEHELMDGGVMAP